MVKKAVAPQLFVLFRFCCQPFGTVLPLYWHKLAHIVATRCHYIGTTASFYRVHEGTVPGASLRNWGFRLAVNVELLIFEGFLPVGCRGFVCPLASACVGSF